jgi:hypothetical protein
MTHHVFLCILVPNLNRELLLYHKIDFRLLHDICRTIWKCEKVEIGKNNQLAILTFTACCGVKVRAHLNWNWLPYVAGKKWVQDLKRKFFLSYIIISLRHPLTRAGMGKHIIISALLMKTVHTVKRTHHIPVDFLTLKWIKTGSTLILRPNFSRILV